MIAWFNPYHPHFPANVILLVTGVLLLSSLFYPDVSGNPASRFATMESLVERGTWAIEGSHFSRSTTDKILLNGHEYSTKPPVMPLAGAGVYGVIRGLTGWTFSDNPRITTTMMRLVLQIIPFAVFLFYFWRFLFYWMENENARIGLFLMVAFASFLFGYSGRINNHTPAAFLAFAAFYNAFGIVRLGRGLRNWLGAGIFSGLSVTLDLGALPFLAALGLYLFFHSPRQTLLIFSPVALAPLFINALLNILITGHPIPIYFRPRLYTSGASYWDHPAGYDALREPKWLYFLHMTIGHHGWFAMSPVLLLAFPGIGRLWHQNRRPEALLFSFVSVFVFVYYVVRTQSYGGGCGGMRWLIVTLPFWLLAVGSWLDEGASRQKSFRLFLILSIIGGIHTLALVWDPWTRSPWHRFFQFLGIGSV